MIGGVFLHMVQRCKMEWEFQEEVCVTVSEYIQYLWCGNNGQSR